MAQAEIGFERDIRPLFREGDVKAMSFAFDLSSYDDVRENAEAIYERLANGSMPCDGAWPAGDVQRFRAWIDAGVRCDDGIASRGRTGARHRDLLPAHDLAVTDAKDGSSLLARCVAAAVLAVRKDEHRSRVLALDRDRDDPPRARQEAVPQGDVRVGPQP